MMISLNFSKLLTCPKSISEIDFDDLKTDFEFKISESDKISIENKLNRKSLTFYRDLSSTYEAEPLVLLNPLEWTKKNEWQKINGSLEESINLSVLHNAHVFGGRIRRRNSKFHEFSQLLLNSQYELSKNSYGILDGTKTLPSDLVKEIDGSLYLDFDTLSEPTILKGNYFFVGSIHRHFGHFLVEGLSRLWALDFIPTNIKDDIKYLVYEDSIPEFALQVLDILGIPLDKIVYAPKHAIVERLFVPDISYKTHHWASHLAQLTYNKISNNVLPNSKPYKRIYLSRKNTADRPLENEINIEKIFSSFGFEIITPENLSIQEQIKVVSESLIIAGPVGSQMYLSAFSKSKSLIILAPNNFYLPDDLLLSSIRESDITIGLGSGLDYSTPKDGRKWSIEEKIIINILESLNYE
ncbi:glycosyltransferase family 61 protein [Leclercia adecarboxylata]|uniref:glycosyltransferase family 61 protein n=1 Tax=Leclercia adecarboxylata TaxID=83655 RepID=UPI00234C8C20|nr:glycosyltransferase 61 family protein [Leclercia adecarboxylata]MDC6677407.1 glycosyltransferase family 61 protein [Leclercia adecarboxylata]